MKIVCIGGGPAGLYFGLLMKKLDPAHDITVVERNRPYDTFGWGVVFSDATMDNMRLCDAATADQIEQAFSRWDDIELHFKGRVIRSGGHGFVGIGRKKLLNILQARCEALGVTLVFEREADSDREFPDADLIVASDGINSRIRGRYGVEGGGVVHLQTMTVRSSSCGWPSRNDWVAAMMLSAISRAGRSITDLTTFRTDVLPNSSPCVEAASRIPSVRSTSVSPHSRVMVGPGVHEKSGNRPRGMQPLFSSALTSPERSST